MQLCQQQSTRSHIRWICTAILAFVFLMWFLSSPILSSERLTVLHFADNQLWGLFDGKIVIMGIGFARGDPYWDFSWSDYYGFDFDKLSRCGIVSPRCELAGWPHDSLVLLPLWLPFSVLAALTCLVWLRKADDRAFLMCVDCGYNLTGNVSGICPECGSPVSIATTENTVVGSSENLTEPAVRHN